MWGEGHLKNAWEQLKRRKQEEGHTGGAKMLYLEHKELSRLASQERACAWGYIILLVLHKIYASF